MHGNHHRQVLLAHLNKWINKQEQRPGTVKNRHLHGSWKQDPELYKSATDYRVSIYGPYLLQMCIKLDQGNSWRLEQVNVPTYISNCVRLRIMSTSDRLIFTTVKATKALSLKDNLMQYHHMNLIHRGLCRVPCFSDS